MKRLYLYDLGLILIIKESFNEKDEFDTGHVHSPNWT